MFYNTFVFLTMNSLPPILKEMPVAKESEDDRLERVAIRNRCFFFEQKNTWESTKKFPYDAPMLAKWMRREVNIIAT